MTELEGAQVLRNAADHLLLRYYETTRGLDALEVGWAVGLLMATADEFDNRGVPQFALSRLVELKKEGRKV